MYIYILFKNLSVCFLFDFHLCRWLLTLHGFRNHASILYEFLCACDKCLNDIWLCVLFCTCASRRWLFAMQDVAFCLPFCRLLPSRRLPFRRCYVASGIAVCRILGVCMSGNMLRWSCFCCIDSYCCFLFYLLQ